jgi:hypothetical protein
MWERLIDEREREEGKEVERRRPVHGMASLEWMVGIFSHTIRKQSISGNGQIYREEGCTGAK